MRLLDLPEIDDGLRDYQKNGKHNIYQAWESCRTVLFQMPTGTGKTRLFSSIIRDTQRQAQEEHCRKGVLVLAHRTELIEQIDQTLSFKYGIAHGIVKSGYEEQMHYPVQVASVQTIVRRLDRWSKKGFSYIIIDEAHHAVSPTYLKICKQFPEAKVLGVTATPCRLSGDALRKLFGSLVLSQPVSKFIQQGYLSPYQYYSIKPESQIQRELDSISHFNIEGDYADADMMRICDTNKVRANIIQAYLDYAKGKKGIIYTINQEHNKHICEEFKKIGVRIKAIDSKTPAEERKKTVADFRAGKIDVICNVNIFSEGFDCPDCEFIQLARPTCSLAMYLQQVGRGLRPHERKAQAVILDNVGSYNKFGLPSANRKWRFHFEGSGQRVTKSVQRSVLTVGRGKQEIKEGDEDMVMIFDGGVELNASGSKEVDSVLESIVTTREWFPFGAISMLDEVDDKIDQDFFTSAHWYREFEDIEAWKDYITESVYISSLTDEEGTELKNKKIFQTFKFQHNGKFGICELCCSEKRLYQSLESYSRGEIKANDIYKIVLPATYDNIGVPDYMDRYVCKVDGNTGVISGVTHNPILVPFKYQGLEFQSNGMYIAKKGDKYGIVQGETEIFPLIYDEIVYLPIANGRNYYMLNKRGYYSLRFFEGDRLIHSEEKIRAIRHLVDRIYLGLSKENHAFICDFHGNVLFPYDFSKIGLLAVKDKWEIVISRDLWNDAFLLDMNLNPIKCLEDCPIEANKFYSQYHLDKLFIPIQNGIQDRTPNVEQRKPMNNDPNGKCPEKPIIPGVVKGSNGLWGYRDVLEATFHDISLHTRSEGLIAKNQKTGAYAIIGGSGQISVPVSYERVRGVGKQRKAKMYDIEVGSSYDDFISHSDIKIGDRLIVRSNVSRDVRYNIVGVYKEIKHLGKGVFAIKNECNRYGLVAFTKKDIVIIKKYKYTSIELGDDGDSILLHSENGRPRFVSLKAIAIDD